jgi:Integrase core domain
MTISMLEHVRKIDPIRVMLGDNSSAMCSKVGTVVLKLPGGRRIRLSEVLFVPRLAIHLLSVAQLASKGIMSSFQASGCSLLDSEDENSILSTTSRTSDGLYLLRAEVCTSNNSRALAAMQVSRKKEKNESPSTSKEDLWHARFGHAGMETIRRAACSGAITGIYLTGHKKANNCHTFLLQKATRRPFKVSLTKAAPAIGDVIQTDIAGPLPPTLSGFKYVLSFIDGKTRLMHIYLLTKKSEAGAKLNELVTNFERKHDVKVKTMHGDNAGELTSGIFNEYLRDNGIKFTSSAPYSPESNGLAEKFSRTLFARVRCMLSHARLSIKLWGEAAHHAVFVPNRTLIRTLGNVTPYEAIYGRAPDVSKLRVFGCDAFATRPNAKKIEDNSLRTTKLGHIGHGKYRLLLPGSDDKVLISTSVVFDENMFQGKLLRTRR